MIELDKLLNTASQKRIVFFTGLPGVGKSLYVKLLAKKAQEQNKEVHLLQWDVTRNAFETEEVLAKYPEIDGVTHAMIRKAVGLWARQAVADWHQTQSDDAILIGELPLIGNRLIELVQKHDDDAESLLTSDDSYFVTPVPSVEVRRVIEEARAKSIANPSHHKEEKDAPPNVIEGLWLELHELGTKTLSIQLPNNDYNPDLYAQVYTSLLKHRHHAVLNINEIIKTENSVYDFEANQSLAATEDTAQKIIKEIETTYSTEDLHASVENWYKL